MKLYEPYTMDDPLYNMPTGMYKRMKNGRRRMRRAITIAERKKKYLTRYYQSIEAKKKNMPSDDDYPF